FDADLVGERRQLVENLLGLQARLTAERLGEKHEPHGARHFPEALAQSFLIAWGDETHVVTGLPSPAFNQNLNRSSNAFLALFVAGLCCAGVLVCRSTVVRGANSAHVFFSSFGATRTVSGCVHSKRALVSNDTHWMQLCRSTPQREHLPPASTGSASRFPQREQRNTSCELIRFGVFGPLALCS